MARVYGKEESELMVLIKAKDLIKYTFDNCYRLTQKMKGNYYEIFKRSDT
jgi:ribosomal protein L25 (general stress protein Ctc)